MFGFRIPWHEYLPFALDRTAANDGIELAFTVDDLISVAAVYVVKGLDAAIEESARYLPAVNSDAWSPLFKPRSRFCSPSMIMLSPLGAAQATSPKEEYRLAIERGKERRAQSARAVGEGENASLASEKDYSADDAAGHSVEEVDEHEEEIAKGASLAAAALLAAAGKAAGKAAEAAEGKNAGAPGDGQRSSTNGAESYDVTVEKFDSIATVGCAESKHEEDADLAPASSTAAQDVMVIFP